MFALIELRNRWQSRIERGNNWSTRFSRGICGNSFKLFSAWLETISTIGFILLVYDLKTERRRRTLMAGCAKCNAVVIILFFQSVALSIITPSFHHYINYLISSNNSENQASLPSQSFLSFLHLSHIAVSAFFNPSHLVGCNLLPSPSASLLVC